MSFHTAHVPAL